MRLFNPEWEAIKEFERTSTVRDLLFELDGRELPADHGQVLFSELCRCLPWLADAQDAGVHPIHGAATDHGTLMISRRARLWLRLPMQRLEAAADLVGSSLDLGCGLLRVGASQVRPLAPFAYQYSPFVNLGSADEQAFLATARRQLDALAMPCGLIAGKPRKMSTPTGDIHGYSLMLHDLSLADSIRLQELGLGDSRQLGCGLFVPHKSIKEVAGG
jgi:CRISPR-associated protein Cas6